MRWRGRPRIGHGTTHLGRIFVLSQTLICHSAKEIVVGPYQIFDLDYELGSHPMHPAEDER